ncbi:MAG: hypothetical protein AAF713_06180 [Pseudomonadota bacterium]
MAVIAVAACRTHPKPSRSNAAYIKALAELGAEPRILQWNADPFDAFLACDAVVLRQTWDYQDDPGGFAAWLVRLSRSRAVVLNAPHLAIWNNDKRSLRELGAAGIEIPRTEEVMAGAAAGVFAKLGADRVVLKPAFGGSGVGVRIADADTISSALVEAVEEAPGRPMMVQEYLPEIAHGEWSLAFAAGAFSHAVRKTPKSGEFRVNARFAPETLRLDPPAAVLATAVRIHDEFCKDALYARIDGVVRAGRFVCTELELTDPDLHLDRAPGAAACLAAATLARLRQSSAPG